MASTATTLQTNTPTATTLSSSSDKSDVPKRFIVDEVCAANKKLRPPQDRTFGYYIGINVGEIREIKLQRSARRIADSTLWAAAKEEMRVAASNITDGKYAPSRISVNCVRIGPEWRLLVDEEGALTPMPININISYLLTGSMSACTPQFYGPVVLYRVDDADPDSDPLGSTVVALKNLVTVDECLNDNDEEDAEDVAMSENCEMINKLVGKAYRAAKPIY